MSFILDALKKSESDRQRQNGPALFEVKVAPPKSGLPLWAVAVLVLLGVNLVIVAWVILRRPAEAGGATPGTNAVATQNAGGGASRAGSGGVTGAGAYPGNNAQGPAQNPLPYAQNGGGYGGYAGSPPPPGQPQPGLPQPGQGQPTMRQPGQAQPGMAQPDWSASGQGQPWAQAGAPPSASQGWPVDPASGAPAPMSQAGAPSQSAAGQRGPGVTGAVPALQSGTAGADSPGNPDDYAPAAEAPATSGFNGRVRRGTESGLPLYPDSDAAPSSGLPQLHLDFHVFDARPQARFVMINMHKLREGDSLPEGVRVESITPDGAVLSRNGSKFFLPRQ